MRKCGCEPAQVFDSYAGTIGYAAVTDAGAEHSWIPFSSALYIKCRDNRIFRMFADKLPSILTRAAEKQEGNTAYVIPLPFTRFAFCFAYSRDYVVFTSSVPMMEKVFTALTGGKNLASNDTFLKLRKICPAKETVSSIPPETSTPYSKTPAGIRNGSSTFFSPVSFSRRKKKNWYRSHALRTVFSGWKFQWSVISGQ